MAISELSRRLAERIISNRVCAAWHECQCQKQRDALTDDIAFLIEEQSTLQKLLTQVGQPHSEDAIGGTAQDVIHAAIEMMPEDENSDEFKEWRLLMRVQVYQARTIAKLKKRIAARERK